jgi:hypothetical protein
MNVVRAITTALLTLLVNCTARHLVPGGDHHSHHHHHRCAWVGCFAGIRPDYVDVSAILPPVTVTVTTVRCYRYGTNRKGR